MRRWLTTSLPLMLRSLALPLVGTFTVFFAALFFPGVLTSKPAPPPHIEVNEPIFLRLIAELQRSNSVRPPSSPVHPVSALYNREAVVPPQCYTRTDSVYNPCYVCHQDRIPGRENVMNDAGLQTEYSFSELGQKNHWKNLFEDRTQRVATISDDDILHYIGQDNYSDLAPRLQAAAFQGWIPDLKDLQSGGGAFDAEGFARDVSNWVAFNYKPFPSTFWPTNGSTADVMIRLPVIYRTDAAGAYSREIYKANLAIPALNSRRLVPGPRQSRSKSSD